MKELPHNITNQDLEKIQSIINSSVIDGGDELSIADIKSALIEGFTKRRHRARAIRNGVQFDENGAITSFSPETKELLNRAKEIK